MKKIYSVFLSLFMVFSLVGCAGKASAAGTFEGVGKGRNGDIKVAVTLDDDAKITNIEVKESSETEGVGTLAYDKMIPSMVEGNTVAVDTVSTATITSEGLLEAVKDALKNAGVDEANYTQKASSSKQEDKEYDVDVAIVGGGGAGMAAAASASADGAKVLVLEKTGAIGNVIKLSKNKNLEFYLATGKALFLMKYFFSYE